LIVLTMLPAATCCKWGMIDCWAFSPFQIVSCIEGPHASGWWPYVGIRNSPQLLRQYGTMQPALGRLYGCFTG